MMPLFDNVDNELATVSSFQDKRRAADQVVANFTEDQVRAATVIHDFYRFLPPSVSMGLAAAGYAPDDDVVNRIASGFVKQQSNAALAQTGEMIGQGDVGAAPLEGATKKSGVDYLRDEEAKGGGGGGFSLGNALGAVKHAAIDDWSDPMSKVKGLTRAADTYGRFPAQALQGTVRSYSKELHDQGLLSTVRNEFSPNRVMQRASLSGLSPEAVSQTDVAQAAAAIGSDTGIDQGSGFFSNDDKGLGQSRRASELANSNVVTYADGSQHVPTIGRDIAGAVGLEPGSRGYSVVSGFGDAAVQIAAMKFQSAPAAERAGAKAFKGTAALADDASTIERLRDSIGAIRSPGRRLTYDKQIAQAWLDSKEGSAVAEHFAGTVSTRDIDRITGGKLSPSHLAALADSSTVDEAKAVMQTALDSGDLKQKIGTVAGQVAPWRRTGIEIKDHLPRFANRAVDLVPETRIDLSDARKTLDEADKWASTLKASETERNALHDTLSRISDEPQLVGDGADHYRVLGARRLAMGERRTALVGMLKNASERHMDGFSDWQKIVDDPLADVAKKAAATEKVTKARAFIDDVLGMGSKLEDAEVSYWRDQANTNRSFFGSVAGDEVLQPGRASPSLIAEHIGDTMPMPSPGDVREAFNSPLVSAVMKIPGAQLSKHTLQFVMDKAWKPSHLLRPAFPVRVIGDEQARILAEGGDSIFNHPLRAMAWSIGDSKFADMLPDSLQHGRGDALGRIFDRADEWAGGLNKADSAFWNDVQYKRTEGYLTVKHGQPGFGEAWHDNLGRLHLDPAGQLIANSSSLDEAKQVWWDNLRSVREKLAKAHPPSSTNPLARSGADLLNPDGAASYIDDVAERLHHVTQGNPRLLDAIRTGEVTSTDPKVLSLVREGGGQTKLVNGVESATVPMYLEKGTPNPVFSEALGAEFDDVGKQGFQTRELVGRRTKIDKATEHIYDRAVTKAFSWFLGKPDDFLARSPYARQQYWDEVRSRVAYLHPDDAEQLIKNAESAALPRDQLRTIKRLAGKSASVADTSALEEAGRTVAAIPAADVAEMARPSNWDELATRLEDGKGAVRLKDFDPKVNAPMFGYRDADGKLAGYLSLTPSGAVSELYVDPAMRGQGISQKLYQAAEDAGHDMVNASSGAMTDSGRAARAKFIESKISGAKAGDNALSLDELHHLGASHAVDRTQELLYDLSRRHQIADMSKLVAPFGEAWAEIIKVWAKQLSQPKAWEPLSVGMRAARSEDVGATVQPGEGTYDTATGQTKQRGLFYKDENGNEMVALPMSRQMMGLAGLPQVPIVGKVQGLSLGTTVMPGLGPVAQIPMAAMMDHFQDPKYDSLRDLMFPYGSPRGSLVNQVESAALPPAFAKVLNVNGGLDDRQWTSSVADSMRYLASTGKYNVSGPGASEEDINRLLSEAKATSRTMTLVRAAAQSTSPTAPSYEWAIEDKSGKRVSMLTLGRELHELQTDPDPQVSDNAIETFLSRHGEGAFMLLQGKSIAISPAGGLPPTKEAGDWLTAHKDAQDLYPYAYGLFAPRDPANKFDSNVYWQQMDGGERQQLDPEVMLRLANQKVAQARYYSVRNTLGANINAAQSAALSNFRTQLEKDYPGYSANGDDVPGAPVKATRTQVIGQLESAVKDPKLADSPVTAPLATYLDLRRQIEEGVGAVSGKTESASWATSKQYAPVRQAMFKAGAQIAASSPEFRSVWESVLLPEFDRQLTDDSKVG